MSDNNGLELSNHDVNQNHFKQNQENNEKMKQMKPKKIYELKSYQNNSSDEDPSEIKC